MERLPNELIFHIIRDFDNYQLHIFKQCCRRFYNLLESAGLPKFDFFYGFLFAMDKQNQTTLTRIDDRFVIEVMAQTPLLTRRRTSRYSRIRIFPEHRSQQLNALAATQRLEHQNAISMLIQLEDQYVDGAMMRAIAKFHCSPRGGYTPEKTTYTFVRCTFDMATVDLRMLLEVNRVECLQFIDCGKERGILLTYSVFKEVNSGRILELIRREQQYYNACHIRDSVIAALPRRNCTVILSQAVTSCSLSMLKRMVDERMTENDESTLSILHLGIICCDFSKFATKIRNKLNEEGKDGFPTVEFMGKKYESLMFNENRISFCVFNCCCPVYFFCHRCSCNREFSQAMLCNSQC